MGAGPCREIATVLGKAEACQVISTADEEHKHLDIDKDRYFSVAII